MARLSDATCHCEYYAAADRPGVLLFRRIRTRDQAHGRATRIFGGPQWRRSTVVLVLVLHVPGASVIAGARTQVSRRWILSLGRGYPRTLGPVWRVVFRSLRRSEREALSQCEHFATEDGLRVLPFRTRDQVTRPIEVRLGNLDNRKWRRSARSCVIAGAQTQCGPWTGPPTNSEVLGQLCASS